MLTTTLFSEAVDVLMATPVGALSQGEERALHLQVARHVATACTLRCCDSDIEGEARCVKPLPNAALFAEVELLVAHEAQERRGLERRMRCLRWLAIWVCTEKNRAPTSWERYRGAAPDRYYRVMARLRVQKAEVCADLVNELRAYRFPTEQAIALPSLPTPPQEEPSAAENVFATAWNIGGKQ